MLKNYISLITILALALIIGCQSVTYNGATNLKGESFHDLTINGHAKLDGVTVENVAKFSSALEAKNSKFNEIKSVASVSLSDSVVNSLSASSLKADKSKITDAIVKGKVELDNSTADKISFAGTEAIFKSSKINSIKNTGYTQKRVIVLIDSHVTGDISFESTEDCKILLKGTSKIDGATTNATIEK